MGAEGLEPPCLAAQDPKSCVSANSTTRPVEAIDHSESICLYSGGAGARTLDPLIKNQLLYQLSYASVKIESMERAKGLLRPSPDGLALRALLSQGFITATPWR